MEYKIWLVAEAHGNMVPFKPYQGVKKGKQFASCTRWRLGQNVVLRLMEFLSPTISYHIIMDNYFTFFRRFTHLGINNIRTTGVLNKSRWCKCNIIGPPLNSLHQAKNQCNFNIGWLEHQQGCLHSFFWTLWIWGICLALEHISKKVHLYSRTKAKLTPLLRSEHGFCRQNGPGGGRVLDCCPNEKMFVVPVRLNSQCCSECVGVVSY